MAARLAVTFWTCNSDKVVKRKLATDATGRTIGAAARRSYQTVAGVKPVSANGGGKTGRGVPDIAGNAGSSTGYLVSQPPGALYPIEPVGGTSAAAPISVCVVSENGACELREFAFVDGHRNGDLG